MQSNSIKKYFKKLSDNYGINDLPDSFCYPHQYIPHPAAIAAAKDLMEYLKNCNQFNHDFGITDNQTVSINGGLGKMFGILIVKTSDGRIGYLAGYSGKIGERNDYSGFVPPIADLISPGSFYRIGEEKLNRINEKIEKLENSSAFCAIKKQLADLKAESEN